MVSISCNCSSWEFSSKYRTACQLVFLQKPHHDRVGTKRRIKFWRWSSFCTLGGVLYKTKTPAKFVENRKYDRSPLLLQARIIFDLFSSDFKTILKGSSFLGLRSSFCTHPTSTGKRKRNNELGNYEQALQCLIVLHFGWPYQPSSGTLRIHIDCVLFVYATWILFAAEEGCFGQPKYSTWI